MGYSLLKEILLPSFFCFFIILVGLLKIIFKKKRKGLVWIIVGLSLYYFFSITPGADLLIRPLESGLEPLKAEEIEKKANTIVVLSGGRKSDIIRSSEVLRIFNLRNNKDDLKLIISGTVELDPDNRTSKVENYFISRGVPAKSIIVEDSSQNTRENSKEVIKKIKDTPFFLVTSSYHMKRALSEFERLGGSPIPAPIDFRFKGVYKPKDFIPSSDNLKKSDLAVYEYLGSLYYRFFD